MITVLSFVEKYQKMLSVHIQKDMGLFLTGLSSQEEPKKGDLVFIASPKAFQKAVAAEVGALVIPEAFKDKAPTECSVNVLTSKNPRLLMAISSTELFALDKLKDQFSEQTRENFKSKAFIHPTAKVSDLAFIGPGAFIGKNVVLKDGVIVASNAVIQSKAHIGEDSRIHELAFIGHNCKLGKRCEVYPHATIGAEGFGYGSDFETGSHFSINHQGHVILEDDVHIGSGTKVDRGTFGHTKIGKHTKLDNLCHIAHNCEIGPHSLMAADSKVAGSTKIGAFFLSGGSIRVYGGLNICDRVSVGANSVVNKSIIKPGTYLGEPLKPEKEGLKNRAAFGRLYQIKKDLDKVMKKLNLK